MTFGRVDFCGTKIQIVDEVIRIVYYLVISSSYFAFFLP